ncbi:MAG: TlpA disulfide reductase family protein, partial [Calditrichaceae bacterium]
ENLKFLDNELQQEKDSLLINFLRISYFQIYYLGSPKSLFKKALAKSILNEVSPSSPVWSLNNNTSALDIIVFIATQPNLSNCNRILDNYKSRMLLNNSDPNVKSILLFQELRRAESEEDILTYNKVYNTLVNNFSKTTLGKKAKALYQPNLRESKITPEAMLPEYRFTSLYDSSITYSNEYFAGKVYLIDFWATWCGPCVAEIPNIEKLNKNIKSDRFEILSISLDKNKKDIDNYRQTHYPMDWNHVLLKEKEISSVRQDFEVSGIPRPILVDMDGKIITVDGLLGDNLLETVRHAVANSN